MFTARILLIISPPVNAKTVSETVCRAWATALRPVGLRFAVPAPLQGLLTDLPEGADVVYYHATQGLCDVTHLLTDETHFLSVTGSHAFCPHWDKQLYALWRRCDAQTLFTASITPGAAEMPAAPQPPVGRLQALKQALPAARKRIAAQNAAPIHTAFAKPVSDTVEAEAHLPALKEVLEDGTVTLGKGLALVCAKQPVRTMVVDPAFVFGPVGFLRASVPLETESLSLGAYLAGYTVFALHTVVAYPVSTQPVQRLMLPPPETLPGTTLARFEQLLGFHESERRCSAKAAMGLFGHEDTYPQDMPPALKLNQKARNAAAKLLETIPPLLVTAFVDLPNPRVASAFYLLRFGFLRRINSLAITLFTGGKQERALRAAFPNTQSYPDGNLLPVTLLQNGMKSEEHFARGKMLLLKRAIDRQPEFNHAAWLDMDVLPHPICADAAPDFSALMDDRIHIATVNGVPDPSFIMVPVNYLPQLCKLVYSITMLDAELKRGFSDALLWERIFNKKPAWFAIHPMPRRRMLFLTAFDPRLLSRSLQAQLSNLPKPYYATQADAPSKPHPEKESSLNV